MIIVQESASPQTFKFIPRSYEADSMTLTNEQTNEVFTYEISPTNTTYYLSVTEILDTIENNTYILKVYNGTHVIYYDKVFCTNQDTDTYSVNDGEYVPHTSNNDYIIL